MSKNQAFISLTLEDFVTSPLRKISAKFSSFGNDIKSVVQGFDLFGNKGNQETKKVDKSISDLQNELNDLENKRMFERDIQTVKKLNIEIQDLENQIKDLKNGSEDGLFRQTLNLSPHIQALSQSFSDVSDSLDFVNEIEDVRSQIMMMTDGTPEDIDKITQSAYRLQQQFGDGADEIILAANAMTKNLGGTFEENLTIIEKGYKRGANLNKNMIDTLREYPSALQGLNLANDQVVAIMAQAGKEGVWDDKMIDAIKEGYTQLSTLTDDKKQVLRDLGFNPNDIQQAINQGNILEVFQQISSGIGDLDAVSQRSALGTLFSSMGEDAQGVIMKFDDFSLSIDDVQENLSKFQQRKLKFTGWMADMQSSIADTAASWVPFIQFSADSLSTITQLYPAFSSISSILGSVGKGIFKLVGSFATMIPKVISATAAQWGLNIAMDANPIGAIIIGIIAFVTAIVLLVKNMNKITGWFKNLGKGAKLAVGWLGKVIATIFPVVKAIVMMAFAIRKIIDNWGKIKEGAIDALKKIKAFFSGVSAVISKIGDFIIKKLQPVFDWLIDLKNRVISNFKDLISWLITAFENVKKTFVAIGDFIAQTFIAMKNTIKDAWNDIKDFFKSGLDWIRSKLGGFADVVQQFIQPIINLIAVPFNKIKDFIVGIFDWIKSKFDWLIDLAKKVGIEIGDTFNDAYNQSLNEVDVQPSDGQDDNNNSNDDDGVFSSTFSNNNVQSNFAPTGNSSSMISGNSDAAKVFKVTVNFDQNFTINNETDYVKVKQMVEQTIISSLHDAEIMMG